MHVLYVHQNFPAQFGHIAAHLVDKLGWQTSFVSETPEGVVGGIRKIQYRTTGGATKQNHFCSRTFENTIWHCEGVYRALRAAKIDKPDLIVGHSGFGSTLFLREIYPDVPVINFFEYFYRPHDDNSDMDFRKDLGWQLDEMKYMRSRCRNAMILLDLNNCQLGYCPTQFQKSRFPGEYDQKLRVVFDGIDRKVYHGFNEELRPSVDQRTGPRTIGGVEIPAGYKVITYCSRGFESMRGFDIFMKACKRIVAERSDVIVLIAGTDRIAYGGDEQYTGGKSFKEWVLSQDQYDLDRIKFLGRIDPLDLAKMLAAGDLHIYLTVPFVLSWSMMDAMSAGAVVLGSDTAPIREMIVDGQNGLLANFFDPDDFAAKALKVLDDPAAFRPLGRAAEQMIVDKYSLEAVTPQMLALYEEARNTKAGLEAPREWPIETPRQVLQQGSHPNQPMKPKPAQGSPLAAPLNPGGGVRPRHAPHPKGPPRSPFFG
jgi:glycosyltransferase involved in cell wall biosynthesis